VVAAKILFMLDEASTGSLQYDQADHLYAEALHGLLVMIVSSVSKYRDCPIVRPRT